MKDQSVKAMEKLVELLLMKKPSPKDVGKLLSRLHEARAQRANGGNSD